MIALYMVGYLFMVLAPFALGYWIYKTRGASWRFFLIGALTFIAAQALHIPFNWLVLNQLQLIPSDPASMTNSANLIALAVFGGLSAGVFEEGARYVAYRWVAKDARTWGRGLMMGAGHGGVESILLGVMAAISVISVFAVVNSPEAMAAIPADQLPLIQEQYDTIFGGRTIDALLPAFERVSALISQLALSLMVMQVFTRRNILWLVAAILYHAVVNASAVYVTATWSIYVTEAVLAVFGLISLGIVLWLREPEPLAPEPEPLPEPEAFEGASEISAESLDDSRYT